MTEVMKLETETEALRNALAWYGEQARLARLIHSEGDAGRHALADDGGKRAREVLALSVAPAVTPPPQTHVMGRVDADARRYRWLKMQSSVGDQVRVMQSTPWTQWDAAIDASIAMSPAAPPQDIVKGAEPALWVSPVDLRAWQRAKAGDIWAWSENLEGQCIPLYLQAPEDGEPVCWLYKTQAGTVEFAEQDDEDVYSFPVYRHPSSPPPPVDVSTQTQFAGSWQREHDALGRLIELLDAEPAIGDAEMASALEKARCAWDMSHAPSPQPNLRGDVDEQAAINLGAAVLSKIEDPAVREVAIRNALTTAASTSHHKTEGLTELDEMVASAIEAAMETSPEFNHGWRSMPDKELIPEILDEIPIEYTEKDVAEAIYRYKVRRLIGAPSPQPRAAVSLAGGSDE